MKNSQHPAVRASQKIDSQMKRKLREAKRNPVAEEMNKLHKPKTHKQRKRRLKDVAYDDLKTWKESDDSQQDD